MPHFVDPDRERFALFRDLPRDQPIHMLNLIRLRDEATYDGRTVTGAEAYAAYGRESHPVTSKLGVRIVWSGTMDLMLIGPEDEEQWDICFIAEYPDAEAFISMIRNPEYQRAVRHRTAAVLDSRLIRLTPKSQGDMFG